MIKMGNNQALWFAIECMAILNTFDPYKSCYCSDERKALCVKLRKDDECYA